VDSTEISKKKYGKSIFFIAAPSFSYAPETRFGAGVYGLLFFRFHSHDTITRGSIVDIGTVYTQNKQYFINPTWKIFFPAEKYILVGEGLFQYYTEKYFGIGNSPRQSFEELYGHNLFRFDTKLQKKLLPHFFVGIHYLLEDMYHIESRNPDGEISKFRVVGARGGFASGLGTAITYDSRKNIVMPMGGGYIDFQDAWFSPAFGSSYSFHSMSLDIRKYIALKPGNILAFQFYGKHITGAAPFRMLSLLGGPMIMRGYYYGRFRDNDLLAAQAECRIPVSRSFIVAAFLGAGEVARGFEYFSTPGIKPNFGGGLRYIYKKKEGLDVRLDAGFGGGSSGIYVTAGEAF
jgi:hypothetical protein